MGTTLLDQELCSRRRILYPLLVTAAIAVIIFSAIGVATITGLLPRAESSLSQPRSPASTGSSESSIPQASSAPNSHVVASSAATPCADCGIIESINAVEIRGRGTGLGLAAGGVAGALLGNQIGRGTGNVVATIAGAAGGAFAGNEIEKNTKTSLRYRVRVRMDDGTYRTVSQSQAPAFAAGDKVRIVKGQLVAAN